MLRREARIPLVAVCVALASGWHAGAAVPVCANPTADVAAPRSRRKHLPGVPALGHVAFGCAWSHCLVAHAYGMHLAAHAPLTLPPSEPCGVAG